jgi:hypothetical protein
MSLSSILRQASHCDPQLLNSNHLFMSFFLRQAIHAQLSSLQAISRSSILCQTIHCNSQLLTTYIFMSTLLRQAFQCKFQLLTNYSWASLTYCLKPSCSALSQPSLSSLLRQAIHTLLGCKLAISELFFTSNQPLQFPAPNQQSWVLFYVKPSSANS